MFKELFRKKEDTSDADALLNFADEASTTDKAPDPFHVTEAAAKQIKTLIKGESEINPKASGLRIFGRTELATHSIKKKSYKGTGFFGVGSFEEEEGYSYVYKQPENEEQHADCVTAMENCPVEAIGNDGA